MAAEPIITTAPITIPAIAPPLSPPDEGVVSSAGLVSTNGVGVIVGGESVGVGCAVEMLTGTAVGDGVAVGVGVGGTGVAVGEGVAVGVGGMGVGVAVGVGVGVLVEI